MNYFLSTTSLSFHDYMWSTAIGLIPGSIAFTWIGLSIKNMKLVLEGKESLGAGPIVATIMGLLVSAGALVYVAKIAKREVQRRSEEEEQLEEQAGQGIHNIHNIDGTIGPLGNECSKRKLHQHKVIHQDP